MCLEKKFQDDHKITNLYELLYMLWFKCLTLKVYEMIFKS